MVRLGPDAPVSARPGLCGGHSQSFTQLRFANYQRIPSILRADTDLVTKTGV